MNFSNRYKILFLILGAFLFFTPVVIYALITMDNYLPIMNKRDFGYLAFHKMARVVETPNTGECKKIVNNSDKNYFIPTKTSQEWSEFLDHMPDNVDLGDCGTTSLWVGGASSNHSCIITDDKRVKCWGNDGYLYRAVHFTDYEIWKMRILGDNKPVDDSIPTFPYYDQYTKDQAGYTFEMNQTSTSSAYYVMDSETGDYLRNVKQISLGSHHSCAILEDNTLKCWGGGGYNELGRNHEIDGLEYGDSTLYFSSAKTVSYLAGFNVGKVEVSDGYACAYYATSTPDGNGGTVNLNRVKCWGMEYAFVFFENDYRQTGARSLVDGSFTDAGLATTTNVYDIAVGEKHSCALVYDYKDLRNKVYCWGRNDHYQVRNLSVNPQTIPWPQDYHYINDPISLALGKLHSCVLQADHIVKCWGNGTYGQLGDGNSVDHDAKNPVTVSGLSNVRQIVSGANNVCALLDSGDVYCWGDNINDKLHTANTASKLYSPSRVLDLSNVKQIAAGENHYCALLADNSVKCWGYNWGYQLGINTRDVNASTTAYFDKCVCQDVLSPGEEICDGIDNDCDCQVDEGVCGICAYGETMECGIGLGICDKGEQICLGDQWSECLGAIEPVEEICGNGLDDDCDGGIDEVNDCH